MRPPKTKKRPIGSYLYEDQLDWIERQKQLAINAGGTGSGVVTALLCEAMDLLIAKRKGEIPK